MQILTTPHTVGGIRIIVAKPDPPNDFKSCVSRFATLAKGF